MKLLSQVPSSSSSSNRERELTARKLWNLFKFFPPNSLSEAHPDDVEIVSAIAEIVCKSKRTYRHKSGDKESSISTKVLSNIILVSYVMLYCLRQSECAEFKLSSRNGVSILKKFMVLECPKIHSTASANFFWLNNATRVLSVLVDFHWKNQANHSGMNPSFRFLSVDLGQPLTTRLEIG